jgi:hypothetical protein
MDWDVVYSYTRKQAIEDGVLIDISEESREAGLRFPVAMTSTLYDKYIKTDIPGQDDSGRLWDVFQIFRYAARGVESDTVLFDVIFLMSEMKTEKVTIKGIIGPGDDPNPVITFMFPFED